MSKKKITSFFKEPYQIKKPVKKGDKLTALHVEGRESCLIKGRTYTAAADETNSPGTDRMIKLEERPGLIFSVRRFIK